MQVDVSGVAAALLSIVPPIFLVGCETTGSSPVTASGSSSAIANNPHPDLPANYRKQIAEFMRTQRDALGLVTLFPMGITKGGAEISDRTERSAGSEPTMSSASALVAAAGPISVLFGLTVSTAGSCNWAPAASSASTGRGCSPKPWPAVRTRTSSHSLRPSFSRKHNQFDLDCRSPVKASKVLLAILSMLLPIPEGFLGAESGGNQKSG